MYREYNPNPRGRRVGDCAVRALCKATGQDWTAILARLCLKGAEMGDMPSADQVWGALLKGDGFRRYILPDACPECYTVEDFCRDHPKGVYVLALGGHAVCVENGDWYDSWDSGREAPLYYWKKED